MLAQASSTSYGLHSGKGIVAAPCSQLSVSHRPRQLQHAQLQPSSASDAHSGSANQHSRQADFRTRAAPVKDQQPSTAGRKEPFVPRPNDMQATVTLVPKKNASTALLKQKPTSEDPIGKFLLKCKLAWNLFFPPQQEAAAAPTPNLSPKELGKQRLQMILVADRCGLSPNSLVEMKRNTLAALADCMELEDLQDAHLRFTMTREGGTTYSMAVPILRPGPYADDGTVVGQGRPTPKASDVQAMAAAAAAAAGGAGSSYSSFYEDEEDEFYKEDELLLEGDDTLDADYTDSAATAESAPQLEVVSNTASGAGDAADVAATAARAAAGEQFRSSSRQVEHCDGSFKEQLKELLVEELVHDVEDLASTAGQVAQAGRSRSGSPVVAVNEIVVALPPGIVVDGSSGVLSEQELRAAAEHEVQRLVGEGKEEASEASGPSEAPPTDMQL